ncbi:MAG: hypothetical protein NTX61_18465 [Bacteroidetes bacterium]|nr:hypothetical protein [Bacteroidota bacterium]
MEELNPQPASEIKTKRPLFLTVLCILTFIGSGLNFISSLLISIFFDTFRAVAGELAKTLDFPGMDMILNASHFFFVASFLIYAISAFGAYQMWNLLKRGFHIYTISQILLIISPMYFFKLATPSIADIIFSGLFILLYANNLKHLA